MRPLLLCGLLLGCGASRAPLEHRYRAGGEPFKEHALHVQAEQARAQAARAEAAGAPGVFRELQLRASGISADGLSGTDSVRAGLRVTLERPWGVAALTRSLHARADASELLAEAARAEVEALTCEESVHGRALAERRALEKVEGEELARALSWVEAFRHGGELDPLTIERTALAIRRRLLGREPEGANYRVHATMGELPDVSEEKRPELDRDAQRLLAGIEQAHPKVRAELAEAERQKQLADAESRARTPWLDFIQLDYNTAANGPRDIAGRFAVGIPLDDGSRGRSRSAAALGVSSKLEALSVATTLARSAEVALAELSAIERNALAYRALAEQATRVEALARKLLAERHGTPEAVVQLLNESQAGKLTIIDARERAGEAACALRFATGTDYARWPRTSATAARSEGAGYEPAP